MSVAFMICRNTTNVINSRLITYQGCSRLEMMNDVTQQNVIIIKSFESCYEIYVEHNRFLNLQYIKKNISIYGLVIQ
jgi:hypothetical protein